MISRIAQERSHLELSTIYEVCRILGDSLDLQRTFRAALNTLAAQLGLLRAMVVLPVSEDGQLRVHSAVGLSREEMERGQWQPGEGVIGRVHFSGLPVVVTNVEDSDEFIDRTGAFGPQEGKRLSFIVVPLRTGADHNAVGVLAAQRELQGVARLSDDQRFLTMVATLLAQSVALHHSVSAEHQRLQQETTRLQKALTAEIPRRRSLDNVVGQSKQMQRVFAEVHQAAPSRATVLLRGESGTGKEEIARAIHFLSPRKEAPFIKVNCAALTESLLESELFGHEKGAFTGAVGERKGRFELAHGGTLFLDEVGDISAGFQAKLLRVLQEREFERVGGSRPVKVDVRLICATNRDLERMVQRGEYRADLYYRINVVSIFLPPLRERREDIPPLVAHFLDRYNKENRRKVKVTPEAMQVLSNCYWPGNVRELQNCIERTATMVEGGSITGLAFPCRSNRCLTQTLHHIDKADAVAPATVHFAGRVNGQGGHNGHNGHSAPPPDDDEVLTIGPSERLAEAGTVPPRHFGPEAPAGERDRLVWAMEQCGWVQAKAARLLKVTPRQLGYALQKHRIEVRKL